MTRRICLRFGIIVFLVALCFSRELRAQSLGCVNNQPSPHISAQETKISVVGVEFQGENPLPDAVRAQLVSDILHLNLVVIPEEPDLSWVSGAEAPIRTALHGQGYFRSLIETTPHLIRAEAHERRYVVSVVIESGPQYRLGEIRFANVTAFPVTELRKQFPLQPGELFDTSKVRQGMEYVYKLYASRGYIDATPEPDATIDEERRLINVLIILDENVQYHVGKIEILGLTPNAENLLKSQLEPGQVFDSVSFRNFFEEHKAALPTNASLHDAIQVHHDVRSASVDLIVDFRPCPET